MSINSIENELEKTFHELVQTQDSINREATIINCNPHMLRDMNGQFLLAPILVAKANILAALATLRTNNATK